MRLLFVLFAIAATTSAATIDIPPDIERRSQYDITVNGSSDALRLEPRPLYDMVSVQSTCRWSNCNEPCPDNFIVIPRLGGSGGEKMWDHSHCVTGVIPTLSLVLHIYIASLFRSYSVNSVLYVSPRLAVIHPLPISIRTSFRIIQTPNLDIHNHHFQHPQLLHQSFH